MFRKRLFGVLVLGGALCGISLLASASNADPIVHFEGMYTVIEPVATFSPVLKKTQGFTTVFQTNRGQFTRNLTLLDNSVLTRGATFPNFTITAERGDTPSIAFTDPQDPSQMAVFDFAATHADWQQGGPTLFTTQMFLASNTFKDLDFSRFARQIGPFGNTTGGAIFSYDNAQGVTIDPESNTVTINAGATACFDLQAVPEPASLVLVGTGLAGFAGLWVKRRLARKTVP